MSVSDETTTVSDGILLSDAAAAKVKGLLEQEGRDDLALRVAVQPGGCSGLRYQLFFDERSLDGDVVKDFDGVKVVTDRMSAPYLGGASIDFVDTIEKQGFTIDPPPPFCRTYRLRGSPQPRGTMPPVVSSTFRSPSGASSVTVRVSFLAIMMQTFFGSGFDSVIVTRTASALSVALAA